MIKSTKILFFLLLIPIFCIGQQRQFDKYILGQNDMKQMFELIIENIPYQDEIFPDVNIDTIVLFSYFSGAKKSKFGIDCKSCFYSFVDLNLRDYKLKRDSIEIELKNKNEHIDIWTKNKKFISFSRPLINFNDNKVIILVNTLYYGIIDDYSYVFELEDEEWMLVSNYRTLTHYSVMKPPSNPNYIPDTVWYNKTMKNLTKRLKKPPTNKSNDSNKEDEI